ncbi:MAG: DsbC family protein [Deltaproteobacteria bacterium]|nr:DsbC family protein [Deltaproteobacteria bacterium]
MNIRLKVFLTLCILMVIMTGVPLQAATPEESFRKSYPNYPLESITPTAVPGIYEIVVQGRIAYYAPGSEYIFTGAIITADGKNLTQERNSELLGKKFKDLPLEKALKIGDGPHTVIEITDPDCPFCRKAATFFAERKDVTRHVFFYPLLSLHPNAESKVRQIFCAEDRTRTYEEAMAGKLDDMKFTPCKNDEVDNLLKVHKEIGDRIGVGVAGTPLFLVDGQIVRGANMPQIEKILGEKKKME